MTSFSLGALSETASAGWTAPSSFAQQGCIANLSHVKQPRRLEDKSILFLLKDGKEVAFSRGQSVLSVKHAVSNHEPGPRSPVQAMISNQQKVLPLAKFALKADSLGYAER